MEARNKIWLASCPTSEANSTPDGTRLQPLESHWPRRPVSTPFAASWHPSPPMITSGCGCFRHNRHGPPEDHSSGQPPKQWRLGTRSERHPPPPAKPTQHQLVISWKLCPSLHSSFQDLLGGITNWQQDWGRHEAKIHEVIGLNWEGIIRDQVWQSPTGSKTYGNKERQGNFQNKTRSTRHTRIRKQKT